MVAVAILDFEIGQYLRIEWRYMHQIVKYALT